MSECIHEYRLEFGEMVCDHCGYGQRHIELEVARHRIATQEAEIKVLRGELEAAEQHVKILQEQLARMPVCVGYVNSFVRDDLKAPRYGAWLNVEIYRVLSDFINTPIYIDPAPQEKQG